MAYKPTIGLEIHIELKTESKMFCDCLNDSEEKHPNLNICPVCAGHPGTLPVINKKAVESVLKLGLALGGKIPETSKFDRKNYFYPDLPKGYQISQYDKPLVLGGKLNGVRITRIHLEEDTGRLLHSTQNSKLKTQNYSLVDLNRAGVPLMELVTEPDIKSADEAVKFAKELQLILRYLEISDADMEKGQMRVEANISISKNSEELGTKVEVKNLNSFRAVKDATDYEIKRQEEILGKGEKIKQETRGWNDTSKKTISQRAKEESHDYRYFPEPDLPPLDLTKFNLEELKIALPEMPNDKRERFLKEFGLTPGQIEILIENRQLSEYFENAASEFKSQLPRLPSASPQANGGQAITNYQLLINYLTSDLVGLMNKEGISIAELKITPEHLAHLVVLIEKGDLSSRMAKDILLHMFQTGIDPHQIIKEKGMAAVSDESIIEKAVSEILLENPSAVADYKKGKENAKQFLIGKTMARLKGQGNPEIINKVLNKILTQ